MLFRSPFEEEEAVKYPSTLRDRDRHLISLTVENRLLFQQLKGSVSSPRPFGIEGFPRQRSMKIEVSYALPRHQVLLNVELSEGGTVKDAIERSGILKQFPQINLQQQKVGVYNKAGSLDTVLINGDRVEIYRAITVDPKTVRRKTKAEDGGED